MPTAKGSGPNRRWRAYNPAITNAPTVATTTTTTSAKAARTTSRQLQLEFVNVSNPSETTLPASLSIIRSHVANHIHVSRGRSLALPKHADAEGEEDDRRHALLTSISTHTFQACVRPLVPLERHLLWYYATCVIPEMPAWCNHGGEEVLFLELVNAFWLPFVITDTGLLAAVLLASCRNMLLHNRQGDALGHGQANWPALALRYKIECISSVNAAILAELPHISDATIAKSMVMATDEFLCNSYDTSILHFNGISRMVELKGGLSSTGIGRFLTKAIAWCQWPERSTGENIVQHNTAVVV